jgi:perosamine synthetase
MNLPSDKVRQYIPIVTPSARRQVSRPFWQIIPRFEREYSFKDFWQALSVQFVGAEKHTNVVNHFPASQCFLFRSGRESLFAILKALKLRSGARVGVPLYCCGSVFESIAAAGCVPVFLDVDLSTYSIDPDCLERNGSALDAVVVVHSFGYPTNLATIRTCLGATEIPVIEDCAHALFSEYEGRLIGTHTHASFFSFGLHKSAAVGGGGIALFNDAALAKRAARELSRVSVEGRWSEIRHVVTCGTRALAYQRPVYGTLLASPLGRFRDRCMGFGHKEEMVKGMIRYSLTRMRRSDEMLLEKRFCEFREKLPCLSRNTRELRTAIQGVTLEIPEEPTYGKWNHFLMPVRYRDENRQVAGRRFLARLGVDTAPLFRNCVADARRFGYTVGCPKAEEAVQTVCTVPHYPWLSDSQIELIGESLRESTEVEQ